MGRDVSALIASFFLFFSLFFQSLIGFNYSLLGNFPAEPIKAAPDYFTTVLFQKLTGDRVLRATVEGAAPNATLRTYGFCAPSGGGVVVLSVNLSPTEPAKLVLDPSLGPPSDYVLSPGWASGSSVRRGGGCCCLPPSLCARHRLGWPGGGVAPLVLSWHPVASIFESGSLFYLCRISHFCA